MMQHPSKYTYNILQEITLTEDRTFKYVFEPERVVMQGITKCTNAKIIEDAVLADPRMFEGRLYYEGNIGPVADALLDELARRGIVLEVCPGSNVALGLYRSRAEHPLHRLVYDLRRLLEPTPRDVEWIQLPWWMSPAYVPLRVVRLTLRETARAVARSADTDPERPPT